VTFETDNNYSIRNEKHYSHSTSTERLIDWLTDLYKTSETIACSIDTL